MATIDFPKRSRLPEFSFRWVWTLLLAIGFLLFTWTGFYTVPAESEVVVLRFGRFHHIVSSGLHFKIPMGVDVAYPVPVKRQLKQEFGFGTQGSTNPSQSSPEAEWIEEKSMVTGDLNA